MIFLRPEILFLLIPFFILFGFLLTQKETQAHFFSEEVLKKLRVNSASVSLKIRNVLLFFVGFFIVVALAEPVIEDGKIEVKSKSADIMIALDISDSMLAEDVYPNRLQFAKKKAMELLKVTPDERIGVIAFAKNSYLVSPMSFDHSAVAFLLDKLHTGSITEKGTNFISLLEVVNKTIKTNTKKYLLLFTDGGDDSDFSEEIAYAKENDIVVFVLGFGTSKGAPIRKKDGTFISYNGEVIVSKLNDSISQLATKTGGVYIESVKSQRDIEAMIEEIISTSDQKELKSETIDKFIPLFYYPLGMAVILFLLAVSSMYSKNMVKSFLFLFLVFSQSFNDLKAGVLDFIDLKNAKEAYEKGDYNRSQQIFDSYAKKNDNAQSYYNSANALYKQEKYEDAIKEYEKAFFDDNRSNANKYANMGNSYVKQGSLEDLKKSLEVYEKSLNLYDDEKVRENYEAVKKVLEEQEKKDDQQDQQEDKNQDSQQNQEKNKEQKTEDQESKKNDESKNSENSEEPDQNKENQSKDEKSEKDNKQSEKNQNPKEMNQDKKEGDSNEEKSKEQKKKELEELEKQDDEQAKEDKTDSSQVQSAEKMSDAEQEKWMQKLNASQNTFMYMLNDKSQIEEQNNNEKPW